MKTCMEKRVALQDLATEARKVQEPMLANILELCAGLDLDDAEVCDDVMERLGRVAYHVTGPGLTVVERAVKELRG